MFESGMNLDDFESSPERIGELFWKMLHIVAINFPSKAQGLTAKRLKGYFYFFRSLEHVLPFTEWRNTWREVTRPNQPGALVWKESRNQRSFKNMRTHKELSTWLSGRHNAIRRLLGQRITGSPDTWFRAYSEQYRKINGSGGNVAFQNNQYDSGTISDLEARLQKSDAMMHAYLKAVWGDDTYFARSPQVIEKALKDNVKRAAKWYYQALYTQEWKTNASFKAKSAANKGKHILYAFDEKNKKLSYAVKNTAASWKMKLRQGIQQFS
jgi:hypothetical protein